jgi:4-amino-4-deoxy-L-arabinose transferase-like glycosyltransferase
VSTSSARGRGAKTIATRFLELAGSLLGSALHAVGRVPVAGRACALVALANGLAWSLLVPPFQVPDENAHYAYVQQVAERGTIPRPTVHQGPLSPAEDVVLADLLTYGVIGHEHNLAPFTEVQQRVIENAEAQHLSARGSGDALSASGNPPLYYVLEAAPYKLAGGVLDKLAAMRVLSALLGAVTVLLIFLFLSELLPATPWAWTAGALVAAFQPLFAFMSAGVNNDSLLYLAGAGLLWAIARAFRRGLGPGSGALSGGFLGLGLVAKFTMLGLIPAVALAIALLLVRARTGHRRRALQGAAWAVGLAVTPLAIYALLSASVWHRAVIVGGVGGVAGETAGRTFSFREEVSHVWQLFLPRLWMRAQFTYYPPWNTWFVGSIGRFGWNDYGFAAWLYQLARVVCLAGGALAVAELWRRHRAVVRRVGELCVYALALAGLCVVIGVQSYRYLIANGGVFEQARYLLPLLGLYAGVVALAVRVGGRRWGPLMATVVVLLAVGHDLWAQAITVARYYT